MNTITAGNAFYVGMTLTCAETGRQFIAAKDGCSFNYAVTPEGLAISDEGVHIREVRAMRDRTKPFGCYISSDGKRATGWKGNTLGNVVAHSTHRNNLGAVIHCYTIRDVHGAMWHGRNGGFFGGPGCCITLRASRK